MKIKVVAKRELSQQTTVYYLNLTEPKHQQLYMGLFKDNELTALTIYNPNTKNYEEVTSLFPQSFLQNLSNQITMQLNNKSYNFGKTGTNRKIII